jgi:hypothetical protein
MKRILWFATVNIDVVVALLLSVLFGLLDVAGAVSTQVMNGVIVLTLAALAASMLHNRRTRCSSISACRCRRSSPTTRWPN